MCKQLVFVRVTSLKAIESLIMIETFYHLSGNLHWLDSGVSPILYRECLLRFLFQELFQLELSSLAIFRKTLATLRSIATLLIDESWSWSADSSSSYCRF